MTSDKTLQMEAEQAAKAKYPYVTEDMPSRVATLRSRMSFIQGYLARAAKEGWQPIETAPKDGTYILIHNDRGTCVAYFERGWGQDGWWLLDDGKNYEIPLRGSAPTHWHPIPTPAQSPSHDKE